MIRISQLKLPITHTKAQLEKKIAKTLKNPGNSFTYEIRKQSLDCRHKNDKIFVYTVDVTIRDEQKLAKKVNNNNIMLIKEKPYEFPSPGETPLLHSPVIVGSGPAGLFCGWYLAKAGYCPIILERGEEAEKRQKTVENFWKNGVLDPESNVQFGEGGAGTFSDGKLNTLVKDVSGRNGKVLETFVEAGADGSILYDSRPHIGTDVLREVVKNIRKRIQDAGGEVRFGCRVEQVLMEDGRTGGVLLAGGERIQSRTVVLAVGHSARALFSSLWEQKVLMEPKAFAVGLRVQHPQKMINLSQYGREDAGELGAAPYKVTASTKSGRGVYSFCMCPGGYVVNASSEKGRLAVNGMSNFRRDGENANSAIIVSVTPGDFPVPGALGGVEFQRRLEEKAFLLGNGRIPVQLYGDFKEDRRSEALGDVAPQFCGGYALSNLRELMPEALNTAFIEGMEQFGKKIRGFDRSDALLAGIESRTSSPLKIIRDENLESSVKGLYPCGEGAGYAGGITSAAMDGLKVAEEIIRRYCPA